MDVDRLSWTVYRFYHLTVVAVVLAFLTAIGFSLYRAEAIGVAAQRITSNAIPSVEHLSAARDDVARVEVLVSRYVLLADDGRRRAQLRQQIEARLGELRREVEAYRALPTFPGEQEHHGAVLARVDALADRARDMLRLSAGARPGPPHALVEDWWQPAVAAAEESLMRGESLNTRQMRMFVAQIESTRQRSRFTALVLGGAALALAVTLAVISGSVLRRSLALQAAHERLREQRETELELFAARVAHDVLSPLNAASLALQQIARAADERSRRTAERGLAGIGRVRETVDGLLEFARLGGRPSGEARTDLAPLLRDLGAALADEAAAARTALSVEAAPGRWTVGAAPGVLTSVVTNLIRNAIQHMGERPERRVVVRLSGRHHRARVEVEDTGPGIPPELRRRVFEPYYRTGTRTQGLGLGLATAKRLVEAHGGEIGVTAGDRGGALFWFELPLADAPAPRPQPAPAPAPA